MLRSACIFLAAILLPSLVLAFLAVRSARDQQILVEHQQAIISQDVTDSLAKNVGNQIDLARSEFVQVAQNLLDQNADQSGFVNFDRRLCAQWPPAEVGFAVDLRGTIYSPQNNDGSAARTFREENDRFLSNRENVEAYSSLNSQSLFTKQTHAMGGASGGDSGMDSPVAQTAAPAQKTLQQAYNGVVTSDSPNMPSSVVDALKQRSTTSDSSSNLPRDESEKRAQAADMILKSQDAISDVQDKATLSTTSGYASSAGNGSRAPAPPDATQTANLTVSTTATTPATVKKESSADMAQSKMAQKINQGQVARNVSPLNNLTSEKVILSNTIPEESDFRKLIGSDTSGAIARFLDNKLQLLVWFRSSATDNLVLGAQLNQTKLIEKMRPLLQAPELQERDSFRSSREPGYCLALLDDKGQPVALSIPGFTTDWKHPFVATEIGETLPHWEAGLYLTDPQQFSKSARTLRLTVVLIVLLLVVAIAAGGSLIAADIRRQIRVAQQKTDFVSNVSHELKTPLTSIRMFADLLAEGRVTEPERQLTYLKIISAESARLTRLINNVLDFARQERGISSAERRACDLVETTRDVVETCLPHLQAAGQNLSCEIESESLPIVGDRDALAQIVLNLISNAEKYGGGEILVRVRRQETSTGALGCVDVLDHGPGIPPKQVESVFLPFRRLDDSLSSGIPGSGLGLTLARRMARVHGGDITYTPRAGGGSCFTLAIPLSNGIS